MIEHFSTEATCFQRYSNQ